MIFYTTRKCPRCKKLSLVCYEAKITYYNDTYEFVCDCGNLIRFKDNQEFIQIEECPEGSAKAIRADVT